MNTRFVVAAGIPPDLGDLFQTALGKALEGWTILARLDLAPAAPYTPEYAASLYERTANKLRRRTGNRRREDLLAGVHLVLLYVARESKSTLVDAFKLEALTVPLTGQDALHEDRLTPNARQRVAKNLASEAVKALKGAKRLLAVIEEEVSQRDNKTCLLLPPKNLGKPSAAVIHCVQEAASIGRDGSDFKKQIQSVAQSLKKHRQDGRSYFVGKHGFVFRAPSKARLRHGYAPTWEDAGHVERCVLRGRLRFGAPFDPRFHYDCDVNGRKLKLPNCCDNTVSTAKRDTHVNIAPNDNVRK